MNRYVFYLAEFLILCFPVFAEAGSRSVSREAWWQIQQREILLQDCLISHIEPMMKKNISFVGFQIYLTAICHEERKRLRDAVVDYAPAIWPSKTLDEILVLYEYKERFSRDEAIRAHTHAMGFE